MENKNNLINRLFEQRKTNKVNIPPMSDNSNNYNNFNNIPENICPKCLKKNAEIEIQMQEIREELKTAVEVISTIQQNISNQMIEIIDLVRYTTEKVNKRIEDEMSMVYNRLHKLDNKLGLKFSENFSFENYEYPEEIVHKLKPIDHHNIHSSANTPSPSPIPDKNKPKTKQTPKKPLLRRKKSKSLLRIPSKINK